MEQNDKLRLPAITVCPFPGWRGSSGYLYHDIYKRGCKNENTSEGFFSCIENKTFSFSELVFGAVKGLGSDQEKDLSDFKFWTWNMGWPGFGRCYTLNYNVSLGIDVVTDGLVLGLNPKVDYLVYLHEPDFFAITNNKLAMPTIRMEVNPRSENSNRLDQWYILEAFRRTNLNRVEARCNDLPNYNFTDCFIQSNAKRVNCTLPWNTRIPGKGLSNFQFMRL